MFSVVLLAKALRNTELLQLRSNYVFQQQTEQWRCCVARLHRGNAWVSVKVKLDV